MQSKKTSGRSTTEPESPHTAARLTSANVLEAEAGTTGYMGGDTGHGGRTYLRITDLGGTDIRVNPIQDRYGNGGFEVTLGGDCELATMITALKFITQVLEEESKEVYD
jgi:hypothetical protein